MPATSRPLRRVRFLFFDLDGVLVDSRAPITGCMNAALRAHGLSEAPVARLERCIGPPLHDSFSELLQERGAPEALADELVAAYRERYRTASLELTRVFPGIPETLARLSDRYRLAVATSKPASASAPILDHLGLAKYFEHLSAPPDRDTHLEDKTRTLERAIEALDVPGADEGSAPNAAMVGDRHVDVHAGRAHGLATIGVAWGIGGKEELREAGADHLVADVRELLTLLT